MNTTQEKSCNNCYWKHTIHDFSKTHCHYHDEPQAQLICTNHTFICKECEEEIATFLYNGKQYCEDCLATIVGIDKRKVDYYQYYDAHGEYIGNSDDTELEGILLNFSGCEYIE